MRRVRSKCREWETRAAVLQWPSHWLNVGGQIGYVVCRPAGRQNVIRYHDLQQGEGRVPKLQEWFSLIGDASTDSLTTGEDWACIVTFLNQAPAETETWARRVTLNVTGDQARCQIGSARSWWTSPPMRQHSHRKGRLKK